MSIQGRAETSKKKEEVIDKILSMWKQYPTLRLGQLIQNAVDTKGMDLSVVEDEELVRLLAHYCRR